MAGFGETLSRHARYYMFSIFLVFLVPKLLAIVVLVSEDLYRLVNGTVGLFGKEENPFLESRRKFISQAGLVVAAIPFASMLYGMAVTAFKVRVRKKTITFDDLPKSFDGLKIVQISDLHTGSFSNTDFVRSAFEKINSLNPDLVFFTGDLVNNQAKEAESFIPEFKKLKAKFGVYSILGNHDYGDYGPWSDDKAKQANLNRLIQVHRESGWNILLNESKLIDAGNDQLAIVGVENWGASRHFPKKGDLDKAVRGAEKVPFRILLSHDPSHWDAKIKDHAHTFQLTLSGHTHGAQFGIEIPGLRWSPAKYMYKQWADLYEDGNQKIYVNRGLGFIGYMGRIGITPEISLLELKSNQNV